MNETMNDVELQTGQLKGTVTIELFEGEKIVKRVKKNNYINNTFRNAMAQVVGRGLRTQANFGLSNENLNDGFYNAPTVVSLRNNDLPPTPYESEIPIGDVVGYGRVGSTTPDSKRGTFIALESVLNQNNYRKLVFDFPNSSANGTFNNIYTALGGHDENDASLYNHLELSLPVVGSDYLQMLAMDETYIYALLKVDRNANSNSTRMARFTKNNFAKAFFETKIDDLFDVITLNFEVRTMAYLDGYFYFTGANGTLYRSTKANPGVLTLVKTFTTNELYYVGYISVGADPISKKLYILVGWTPTPTAGNLYIVDPANGYSIVNRMLYSNISDGNYYVGVHPQGRYLGVRGYLYDTKTQKMPSSYNGEYIVPGGPFGMPITYTGNVIKTMLVGAFSRFVLDSPVTKTSTQTMKITYEFTLDQAPVTAAPIITT